MGVEYDDIAGLFLQAAVERRGIVTGERHTETVPAQAQRQLLPEVRIILEQADFTLTWRRLADAVSGNRAPFQDLFIDREAASAWLDRLLARQAQEGRPATEVAAAMNRVNPLYVLRNHLAEEAIRAAKTGDAGEIETLMTLLRDPFTARTGYEKYASLPPDWANGIEVSCSS